MSSNTHTIASHRLSRSMENLDVILQTLGVQETSEEKTTKVTEAKGTNGDNVDGVIKTSFDEGERHMRPQRGLVPQHGGY